VAKHAQKLSELQRRANESVTMLRLAQRMIT